MLAFLGLLNGVFWGMLVGAMMKGYSPDEYKLPYLSAGPHILHLPSIGAATFVPSILSISCILMVYFRDYSLVEKVIALVLAAVGLVIGITLGRKGPEPS